MASSGTQRNGAATAGGSERSRRRGARAGRPAVRDGRSGSSASPAQKERKREQAVRQAERKQRKRQESGGIGGWIARRAGQWSVEGPEERFMHRQKHAWNFVMDHYFRMEVEGWHRLPDAPVLLVGVHAGGITPMDAWMLGFAWWRRFGNDRVAHGTAHDGLMAMPGLGSYFRKMGVMPAAPDAISAALDAGHDVMLFPGGDVDAMRPWTHRDEVRLGGRTGFIRQAITSGVPIVPVALVGGADTVFVLWDGKPLARGLGLGKLVRSDVFPIAAGAPWGVAPALVPFFPLPAKIRGELLEPVWLDDDPERAQDDEYVDRMYREVERRLQDGMRRVAKRRSFPVLG